MKWKKTLKDLGLSENDKLTAGLKKSIEAIKELEKEKQVVYKKVTDENINDEQREQLQEEFDEINEAIETIDEQLVKDLKYYDKMKDTWAKNAAKLQEGREKRKANLANGGKTDDAAQAAADAAAQAATDAAAAAQAASDAAAAEEEDKKKKKGGGAILWVLGGLGLIGALVAVRKYTANK
jgi:TolA-binding protein